MCQFYTSKRDLARRALYKGSRYYIKALALHQTTVQLRGRSASEHICSKKFTENQSRKEFGKIKHDDMSFKVILGVLICGIYLFSG
jgi:hypothetical protein